MWRVEDCTRCGACCFSESPRHARVTGDDYARLGDEADRYVEFLGNQAFMRIEGGHCAALVVTPAPIVTTTTATTANEPHLADEPLPTDATEDGTFFCAIYERRPTVCRDLERGSPACEGELALKRDRPKRRLAVLRSARTDQGSDIEG